MYAGGVKVDSFIYSPLLPSSSRGSVYSNMMHVSDWFPTILELAGVTGTDIHILHILHTSITCTTNRLFDLVRTEFGWSEPCLCAAILLRCEG